MSELLSEMCKVNSAHLELVLKKAIKHNEKVFNNLKDIVLTVKTNVQEKNLPYVLNSYDICKKSLKIHNSILCMDYTNYSYDTMITDM